MRSLSDEFRRVVQGETQNPKFIQAMMKHGYKGASDMSNVVSHSFGWDATSDIVPDLGRNEGYANKYALDTTVQDWMRDVNPWAFAAHCGNFVRSRSTWLLGCRPRDVTRLAVFISFHRRCYRRALV